MELLRSLNYPRELWALVKYNFGGKDAVLPKLDYVCCENSTVPLVLTMEETIAQSCILHRNGAR